MWNNLNIFLFQKLTNFSYFKKNSHAFGIKNQSQNEYNFLKICHLIIMYYKTEGRIKLFTEKKS